MRILMLGSKEYPFGVSARHDPKAGGGIEFHVEKLSKYLARGGHDVYVITRCFPGQRKHETIAEGNGKIHVYRTGYVPNKYLRAFSFNLLSFLKAICLIRNEKMDIIHAHAIVAGFFGAKLSRLTGKPMVLTPHGTIVDWGFPVREALTLFQKVSLKFAKRVIFISKPAQEKLSLLTKSPSALLTNAIDPEDYTDASRPARSLRGKDIRFLFLGRLEKIKGLDTLIEAFSSLIRKFPDAGLVIAGEGSIRNQVVDLVVKANTDKIRYVGWVESKQALKDSDVFVLPSKERGQPVALLEAMAAGKIIITSLPFIRPGRTGIYCRAGDPKDLAKKMLAVCRDFGKYKKLGEQARKESVSFTWESTVNLFEREYVKVLASQ
jgi:glycogen(starch) synthase